MAGKFNYPSGDDEMARRIQQAQSDATEQSASVARSIWPIIEYLTGANGVAQSSGSWSSVSTANVTAIVWMDFDDSLDASMQFTAPSSGRIRVQNEAYLKTMANAVLSTGVSVQSDTFIGYEVLDASGFRVNTLGERSIMMHAEVWSTNQTMVLGMTSTAIGFVQNLTPGGTYTIRTRRGYRGWAQNASGSVISMPTGSWFSNYADPVICAINPA
ncbi:hypothetical protein BPY_06740 [Bifidobacterium psychraerophilum]|uniref:hypothetical protein n=1 Tax=Bifidobacterium psychraerophilum TaxID=218140 RepID=UPI0031157A36